MDGDRRELDDRLRGILFPGTRKPDRILRVLPSPTQDNPGGYNPNCFFDFFRHLPPTAVPMELCGRICLYDRRGIFHVL